MITSLNKLADKLKSLIAVSLIAGMVSVNGFAHDSCETEEIVEDTMIVIYRTNADQDTRNIGDLLNCYDFCASLFFVGSDDHSKCIAACNKQNDYTTGD